MWNTNFTARAGSPSSSIWAPCSTGSSPQAGRFRQFHQFGVELLGTECPLADAEVITVAVELYKELGLTDLEVLVNSIGCPAYRKKYQEDLFSRLEFPPGTLRECLRRWEKTYAHFGL